MRKLFYIICMGLAIWGLFGGCEVTDMKEGDKKPVEYTVVLEKELPEEIHSLIEQKKEHDFQMILRFYTEKMEEASGEALSERLRFLLEMYCQGSIYMTVQWVSGRLHRSPEEMAGELVAAMPGELAEVFRSLHLL